MADQLTLADVLRMQAVNGFANTRDEARRLDRIALTNGETQVGPPDRFGLPAWTPNEFDLSPGAKSMMLARMLANTPAEQNAYRPPAKKY